MRAGSVHSEETKLKMKLSHIGKVRTEDTKSKISRSMSGRIRSTETRIKIAISVRTKWISTKGGMWYGNIIYNDRPNYCDKFNNGFKERVRAYWDYKCFECGTPQLTSKLMVHHIHYNKKMCCDGSPRDVIPLCNSCHSKTNGNRDHWEKYFTSLLYNYDPTGKCFFTRGEWRTSSL